MGFGWWHRETDCQRVKRLLSSYIDGQVPAEDARLVDAHVETCPSCREELASLRATVDLLRRLPAAPLPRSFALPVIAVASRPSLSPAFFYLRNATAAVAVLLIALIAGGFVLEASAPMYGARAPAADGATLEIRAGREQGLSNAGNEAADLQRQGQQSVTKEPPALAAPAPAEPAKAAAAPSVGSVPTAVQSEAADTAKPGGTPETYSEQATAPAGAAPARAAPPVSAEASPESPLKAAETETGAGAVAGGEERTVEETTPEVRPGREVTSQQPGPPLMPEPVARYGMAAPPEPLLRLAKVGMAGLLVLLGSVTGAVWLRDRRRQG